jgi:hypothetical protein
MFVLNVPEALALILCLLVAHAQSINEAVVAKKQRAPRKSILKHSAPADELEEEEEEGQSAKDGSLFALLLPGGIAVGEITAEWRAKYGTDPTAALAELYTLVARVSPGFRV